MPHAKEVKSKETTMKEQGVLWEHLEVYYVEFCEIPEPTIAKPKCSRISKSACEGTHKEHLFNNAVD